MAGGLGGVRGVGGVSRKRIKKLQLSLLPQGVVFRQAVGTWKWQELKRTL